MKRNWAEKMLDHHLNLQPDIPLPEGVEWLLPYEDEATREVTRKFYRKYYQDNHARILILGINPGRFGAGVTGIPFTDPIRLEEECGIPNPFDKKREISSIFIYKMISEFGSPEAFYGKYLISSLCPLGFLREGKNYNFYDDRQLASLVTPMIIENLQILLDFGAIQKECICLGKGKNADYFLKLNKEHHLFDKIRILPHPRWVMQYRLKEMDLHLNAYMKTFSSQIHMFNPSSQAE